MPKKPIDKDKEIQRLRKWILFMQEHVAYFNRYESVDGDDNLFYEIPTYDECFEMALEGREPLTLDFLKKQALKKQKS